MEDSLVKTQLRLPLSLQEKLVEAAKASGRSMNAEIVARLEASFPKNLDWLAANRQTERETLRLAVEEQVRRVEELQANGTVPDGEIAELALRRLLFEELEHACKVLDGMRDFSQAELVTLSGVSQPPQAGPSELIKFPRAKNKG